MICLFERQGIDLVRLQMRSLLVEWTDETQSRHGLCMVFNGSDAAARAAQIPFKGNYWESFRIGALQLPYTYSPRISTNPSTTCVTSADDMRANRLPIRSTDKVRI